MSYCRWSSDNWTSDVYVYESCDGGYDVHVATKRYVNEIPKLPPFDDSNDWYGDYHAQMEAVKASPTKEIGGKFDGMSFNVGTLESLALLLEEISMSGYHVPAYVFTIIKQEMAERNESMD